MDSLSTELLDALALAKELVSALERCRRNPELLRLNHRSVEELAIVETHVGMRVKDLERIYGETWTAGEEAPRG